MQSNNNSCAIRIPMISGHETIEFFPDELPTDHNDLIDVLRSELAPFKVWRACAIEYHRQGMDHEFDAVLTEIVGALEDSSVDKIYRERDDYAEGITEIYVALASKALGELAKLKRHGLRLSTEQSNEFAVKVVQHLASADEKLRINEYTWLIKGFYEIIHGELRRAEDHFRAVHDRATKVQNQQKRKYLFGSLLGLGIVFYARQKYQLALDQFSKAVESHPSCGASVRLAIACCCFRLEQYERARLAVDRALLIEPANANVLLMRALLEQPALVQKDRSVRNADQRSAALELAQLALLMDPDSAVALNLLAGHRFSTPQVVSFARGCHALGDGLILLPRGAVEGVAAGDQVTIGSDSAAETRAISAIVLDVDSVVSVREQVTQLVSSCSGSHGDFVLLQLDRPEAGATVTPVSISVLRFRELTAVVKLASRALQLSGIAAQRAESHYWLGRVAHCRGALDDAFECYRHALKEAPELSLAAFGAAQILLSRGEHATALELFEKVLGKNPDDRDTQAYVMLLNAAHKGQAAPFEKLREVAPGFALEIDLWLLQGQLRQKSPADHALALKCYLHAKDCIEQLPSAMARSVPPSVLSNIAVLQHSVGRLDKAIEFCQQALASFRSPSRGGAVGAESIYRNAEFDGVFYAWGADSICSLAKVVDDSEDAGAGVKFRVAEGRGTGGVDLAEWVATGDEVVIGDVRYGVREVSAAEIVVYSPVWTAGEMGASEVFPLFVRESFDNFVDETVTYCFNLARLLEEGGRTRAASEVYVELLKRHPSFIECYLRLSVISCDIGKFDDATVWLTRALEVSEEQPDATICLGDLYYRNKHTADAKRCYDRVCASNRHDARSMLSLGNFYFAAAGGSGASQLKESYKFYFHVLNEDSTNIYAANGLGMVCAEKAELEAAREVFCKAREACAAGASSSSKQATLSGDINTNLAHVYLAQNRVTDAERLYQATYKSLSRASGSEFASERSVYLTECVALAQFRQGRNDDSLHSMLKAVHADPSDIRLLFNAAIVAESSAASLVAKRGQRTTAEISEALEDVALAARIYSHLRANSHALKAKAGMSMAVVATHLQQCEDKKAMLTVLLGDARTEEDERQQQRQKLEEEHSSRLRVRQEERERLTLAQETERREKQQLVAQKEQRLQELREKWVVVPTAPGPSSGAGKSSAGGSKRKRKDKSAAGGGRSGSDSDGDVLSGGEEGGGDLFDAKVDRSKYQGEIDFGSSSDEDDRAPRAVTASAKAVKSQLESDLFGDEDEDEDEGDDAMSSGRKRKAAAVRDESDDEGSSRVEAPTVRRLKRRTVAGDEKSDDEVENDTVAAAEVESQQNDSSGRMSVEGESADE